MKPNSQLLTESTATLELLLQKVAKHGKAWQSDAKRLWPVRTCQDLSGKLQESWWKLRAPPRERLKTRSFEVSHHPGTESLNRQIYGIYVCRAKEVRSLWQSRCKKGTSNMDQKAGRLYSICSRFEVILVNWSPWFGFALHWGVRV